MFTSLHSSINGNGCIFSEIVLDPWLAFVVQWSWWLRLSDSLFHHDFSQGHKNRNIICCSVLWRLGVWKKKENISRYKLIDYRDMRFSFKVSSDQEITSTENHCFVCLHMRAWEHRQIFSSHSYMYISGTISCWMSCLPTFWLWVKSFYVCQSYFWKSIVDGGGGQKVQCWITARTVWPCWVYPKCLWTQG